MGTLIAKIKNDNQWVKICDQIEIGALDQLDLSDCKYSVKAVLYA